MPRPVSTVELEELLAHHAFVRGLARSLLRDVDLAEDVVQETYRAALTRPPREEGRTRAWLAAVCRNLARVALRREGRRRATESVAVESGVATPGVAPAAGELVERVDLVRRAVTAALGLDEPWRSVVLLRHFENLSPPEIATRLGTPLETVRTRLKRGHAILRDQLERELGGRDRLLHGLAVLANVPSVGSSPLVPASTEGAAPAAPGVSPSIHAMARAVLPTGVAAVTLVVAAALLRPESEAPSRSTSEASVDRRSPTPHAERYALPGARLPPWETRADRAAPPSALRVLTPDPAPRGSPAMISTRSPRPRGSRLAAVALGGLAAAAPLAAGQGFTLRPGWPIPLNGSSVDGGLLIDMDGDPELELVQVVGTNVHVFNPDGSLAFGWPQPIGYGTFSAPAAADLDGDGVQEIVIHASQFALNGRVFAFDRVGQVVPGFPLNLGGPVKAPAIADLDGDGDDEILSVVNQAGVGRLFAIDGNGSVRPGFPVVLDHVGGAGPAVGDVDGDGTPEIFALSYVTLYGLRADGTTLPGFPITPGGNHTFNYNTPGLADLDDDGDLEIAVTTSVEFANGGAVRVYHHDGTPLQGWPRPIAYASFVPVSIADVDGDGGLDVVVADQLLSAVPVNRVYAWRADGTPLPGFPIGPLDAVFAQVIVADIDGDGDVELLFDQNVAVSDLLAYHHDGTPVAGWSLPMQGSSFQQSPSVADIDGDGFLDLAASGNLIASGNTVLYEWASGSPWDASDAPVRTHQYGPRRDGATEPPGAAVSYGCVGAPTGSLEVVAGSPELGVTMVLGVDNPLGTQAPGAAAVLALASAPDPAYPCGSLLPASSMTGPYGPGELLLHPAGLLGVLGPVVWPGPTTPAAFPLPIPVLPGLVGLHVYFQGAIVEGAGKYAVTRGLDVRFGE